MFILAALAGCSDDSAPYLDSAPLDLWGTDLAPDAGALETSADQGPDAFVPFSLLLTVNEVPASMNGSLPFIANDGSKKSYRLNVPTHGYTVDVSWRGSLARASTLKITCDQDLGLAKAGADLTGYFTITPGKATLLLPSSLEGGVGTVTFKAALDDGSTPRTSSLSVELVKRTYKLDPFRLLDTWVVVFSLDNYAITPGKDAAGW